METGYPVVLNFKLELLNEEDDEVPLFKYRCPKHHQLRLFYSIYLRDDQLDPDYKQLTGEMDYQNECNGCECNQLPEKDEDGDPARWVKASALLSIKENQDKVCVPFAGSEQSEESGNWVKAIVIGSGIFMIFHVVIYHLFFRLVDTHSFDTILR